MIGPKFPTHRQVLNKAIFYMLRNLSTHFNPYSTIVAMWQQGLQNFLNNFLTMFLGFQKLSSILLLIVAQYLFAV